MWFEILPSLIVVGGSLGVPHFLVFLANKLYFDNAYKRKVQSYNEAHCFLRDMRISGENNAYKQIGLGCTCQKPEPTAPCECTC